MTKRPDQLEFLWVGSMRDDRDGDTLCLLTTADNLSRMSSAKGDGFRKVEASERLEHARLPGALVANNDHLPCMCVSRRGGYWGRRMKTIVSLGSYLWERDIGGNANLSQLIDLVQEDSATQAFSFYGV